MEDHTPEESGSDKENAELQERREATIYPYDLVGWPATGQVLTKSAGGRRPPLRNYRKLLVRPAGIEPATYGFEVETRCQRAPTAAATCGRTMLATPRALVRLGGSLRVSPHNSRTTRAARALLG